MISLSEIKSVYNCKFHPRVESGEITEDEVLQKFMQRFGDKNRDGKLTWDEFMDYYAGVSSNVKDDAYFVEFMCRVWNISEQD